MTNTKKQHNGFTLVELTVVIAIMSALLVTVFFAVLNIHERIAFADAETAVLTSLEKARNRALTGFGTDDHGVHIDGTVITMFEGSWDPDEGGEVSVISSLVNVSPEPFNVVFTRLTGTANAQSLTITAGELSSSVDITADGTISTE